MMLFVIGIWIWVDLLLSGGASRDSAEAAFLGKLNVAFGLIFIAGALGTLNGWRMAKTGHRSVALIVTMLVAFGAGLLVAFNASNGFQTP